MNAGLIRGIGRLSNFGPDSTNTSLGTAVGQVPVASDNTLIGCKAGASLTSSASVTDASSGNTLIGSEAGRYISASTMATSPQTAIGYQAMRGAPTGATLSSFGPGSTAVGYQALLSLTSGGENTAIGYQAYRWLTIGYRNTAVGTYAGADPTYIQENGSPLDAHDNTFIGYRTGTNANSYSGCVAVGSIAGVYGDSGTAIGSGSVCFASAVVIGSSSSAGALSVAIGTEVGAGSASYPANSIIVGYRAGRSATSTAADSVIIGHNAHYAPNNNSANALTTGLRNVALGRETGFASATQRNDTVAIGYRAIVNGNNAVAIGSGASAGAAGAVAIGKDSGGTSASTTTQDGFRLGTTSHIIEIPGLIQWLTAGNEQTTVGAAGGASALPATPTKFLKIKDSAGTTLVIPAYAAA